MKKLFLIIITFTSSILYSQDWTELNTIITLNNEICKNLIEVRFLQGDEKSNSEIKTIYLPGKLKVKTEDIEKLTNNEIKAISIKVIVPISNEKGVKYIDYIIPNINFNLLMTDYFILKIYDLSDKKLKKQYYPLEGKCYTFEFDSPLQSINRVKKKDNGTD